MISKIEMANVASYAQPTTLETDKKINLIYGLNGAGKSVLTKFLSGLNPSDFADCTISKEPAVPVLVYNQDFIHENFYVADNLKGIFSLSKQNKEAEQRISEAENAIREKESEIEAKKEARSAEVQSFGKQKTTAVEKIWEIKSQYSGGDRVLEYCLQGLKGEKDKLFSYLCGLPLPATKPLRNVDQIRAEVSSLKVNASKPEPELEKFEFNGREIEEKTLLSKSIVGNESSNVADLITTLKNADWVEAGLKFLPKAIEGSNAACPFCQAETITQALVQDLEDYFDESYKSAITTLNQCLDAYTLAVNELPMPSSYSNTPLSESFQSAISEKHSILKTILDGNLRLIQEKIENPSTAISLSSTSEAVEEFNEVIEKVNERIRAHNKKIQDMDSSLNELKDEFWSLMRWHYDQTISRFSQDNSIHTRKIETIDAEIELLEEEKSTINDELVLAQKETVNVDEAVSAINSGLEDLGINDFEIQKHSDNLYRIVRVGESEDAFQTLSEGEKMVISFLYFCELCKGKATENDTVTKRIAVIDDPISSLSHIFIFNVGRLIRALFFNSKQIEQVFVLTHSLYFFYELTDPDHERRKKSQLLFRITKTDEGSSINMMKYEEIQNDYQSYWSVVNDDTQHPALIANCMRNIVEYFFNFVRRKDLNNVFQMEELQENRLQAFSRYINRESHSLGQNIIDLKEFDYATFKDGLRLVFEKAGYPEHYSEMSKI